MHTFFVKWMQWSGLEDSALKILLDFLAQLEVLVHDFPVEICHALVRSGTRVWRVESVHVVFLARCRCRGRYGAHQMHETGARVG